MATPPQWGGRSPYDIYGSSGPPGPPGPPIRPRRRRGPVVLGFIAIVLIGALALSGARLYDFLRNVANVDNPFQLIPGGLEPPAGSIPYKLKHGQQVNILALGYGGAENDAPYLTD